MSGRKQVSFSDTFIIRTFEDLVHSDEAIIKFFEDDDNPVLLVGGKGDNLKAFITQRLKKMFLLRNTTRKNKKECRSLLKTANTRIVEDVLRSVLAGVMSAIETGSIPQQPRKDFCADVSRMVDSIQRIQSLCQCDVLFFGELHNKPSSVVQTMLMDFVNKCTVFNDSSTPIQEIFTLPDPKKTGLDRMPWAIATKLKGQEFAVVQPTEPLIQLDELQSLLDALKQQEELQFNIQQTQQSQSYHPHIQAYHPHIQAYNLQPCLLKQQQHNLQPCLLKQQQYNSYLEDRNREDRHREDRYREDRYREDRHREDRYREDRYREDRHREDRYREDRHREDRHLKDRRAYRDCSPNRRSDR